MPVDDFPAGPLEEKPDVLDDRTGRRFGQIAKWGGLITQAELDECIREQMSLRRLGKEALRIGEIMVSKELLTQADVDAIIRIQRGGNRILDDTMFGAIAKREGFVTAEELDECICLQKNLLAVGKQPPFIGHLLHEKKYMIEEEILYVLRHQQKERSGLLCCLTLS